MGKVLPGIDVKLANGEEGEILIKSPHMFTRYLGSPEATAATFTPDGWYKSGDIARRERDYYFILGRASIDSKPTPSRKQMSHGRGLTRCL